MSRCEKCVCSENGKCTASEPCLEYLIAVGRVVMRHQPLRSMRLLSTRVCPITGEELPELPKRPERALLHRRGLVGETLRRR